MSFIGRIRSQIGLRSVIPDARVEKEVRETIASWGIDVPAERLELPISTGTLMGAMSYTHTSLEVRVAMSLFTFLIACFDDDVITPQARREFVQRYHFRQPQLHPLLDKLVSLSHTISEQLPSYSGNAFIAGVLQYCNEDVLAKDQSSLMHDLINQDAKEYVEYVRMADGIPVPYMVIIWPELQFSDIKEYIQALP